MRNAKSGSMLPAWTTQLLPSEATHRHTCRHAQHRASATTAPCQHTTSPVNCTTATMTALHRSQQCWTGSASLQATAPFRMARQVWEAVV